MHLLVVANETVAGRTLIDAIERHRGDDFSVTVICPVSRPERGLVVYQEAHRAAAGRRLDRTLSVLHDDGVLAHGLVVESDPVTAVRDALLQLHPHVDEVLVATHPVQKSGWLRKNVVDKIREASGDLPVEHVVVDVQAEEGGTANVLVVANETIVGEELLRKIRERAAQGDTSFVLVLPQSDPTQGEHRDAEERLERALAELRGSGIDAHGQVAHPDPFDAALHTIDEERVDEIIVSTFGPERSGWLRRDLIERLREETGLPVEHVVAKTEAAV